VKNLEMPNNITLVSYGQLGDFERNPWFDVSNDLGALTITIRVVWRTDFTSEGWVSGWVVRSKTPKWGDNL